MALNYLCLKWDGMDRQGIPVFPSPPGQHTGTFSNTGVLSRHFSEILPLLVTASLCLFATVFTLDEPIAVK